MADEHCFSISVEEDSDLRLDALVSARIEDCSRSMASDLIRRGLIQVGEQARKPGYRPKRGEIISGRIPAPVSISYEPEPIPLDILFEDRHLIVINKPPGMVVHPAPGHESGTLVNALLHHCPDLEGIGGELRPGIAHRLDKDTSGLLVVAKTGFALAGLADQFKFRKVHKEYLALVHGETATDEGSIMLPIGRHPVDRKRMSTRSKTGRAAKTLWRMNSRFSGATLLEVTIKTGRTHQIRVHCAAMHHPVVGDALYGGNKSSSHVSSRVAPLLKAASRQMLHAWRIGFSHPHGGLPLSFETPPPDDMSGLLRSLDTISENERSWHG